MTDWGERGGGSVIAADSTTAANNTDGLEVINDEVGSRPFVTVHYTLGPGTTATVAGRYQTPAGVTDWFEIDTIDTSGNAATVSDYEQYPWVVFDDIRVLTTDDNVQAAFTIAAGR
jgi:hypothetical protein